MARGLTTNGDGHISGLTMAAFEEFSPETLEDDEHVSGRDPLRRFTPLDEVPDDEHAPSLWTKGSWAKRGHFPIGIAASRT